MRAQYSAVFSQDKASRTKAFPHLSQMWKLCTFMCLENMWNICIATPEIRKKEDHLYFIIALGQEIVPGRHNCFVYFLIKLWSCIHFILMYSSGSLVWQFLFCISQLKDHKGKDGTDTPRLSPKGLKAQKKMKPPDTAGAEINTLLLLQTPVSLCKSK